MTNHDDWRTAKVLAEEVRGLAHRRARQPRAVSIGAPAGMDHGALRAELLEQLGNEGWPNVDISIDEADTLRLLLIEFDRWV
jgi:hypothetical protein